MLTCCKTITHLSQKVLALYKLCVALLGHSCIQEQDQICTYGKMREGHRPRTQQACYLTKKIWTRPHIHRESIPPSKPCQSHSKFDPTASHVHKWQPCHQCCKATQMKIFKQNSNLKIMIFTITSLNIQSRMQYDWAEHELPLVLAPLGRADGNRCNSEPFRSLLTVVPLEETTKHRFPAGLANTYLQSPTHYLNFPLN